MLENSANSTLYYKGTADWMPLPNWASFYLELGNALATRENTEKRTVLGLALPARSYVASFIAVGIIAGKFASAAQEAEANNRFQKLCELPKDTPLFYRRSGKRIKVFWEKSEKDSGGKIVRVCLNTKINGERYYITKRQALQVEFPSKDFSSQPKRSFRRVNTLPSPFLSGLLDTEVAKKIVSQSSLDTLIIGSLYLIQEELQRSQFATKTLNGFAQGTLQDIVRARKFSKGAETYRSDVYHINSKECNNPSHEIPSFVIFNGATSFLRWRSTWRQSHWVVLLDQTEPEFDVAIQAFNEEYVMAPINERELTEFPLQTQVPHIPISIYQDERL